MRFGLYGKLPAKRDFVAVSASRELLAALEPWLQAGLSASRMALGAGWQAAFLRAPIWRFWLGPQVAGAATLGAFMPSVDGVGRYFPLLLFVQAETGDDLPPPEIELYPDWFPAAEDLLLSALDGGVGFEEVTGGLGRLARPAPAAPRAALPARIGRGRSGTVLVAGGPVALPAALAAIRVADHAAHYGGMSFWWTPGAEDFQPGAAVARGMPDPYAFTFMLTGRRDGEGA